MKGIIQLPLFLIIFYYQQGSISGQLYSQGCCSNPYYQSPSVCCPQPCCVQAAAPVLCCQAQEVMKVRLSLKTLLTWDNAYGDTKSDKYKALVNKVQNALKKIYAKTPSFSDARVSQFTKGSTVATFVLAFKMADPDPLKPLRDALPSKHIPDASDAGKIQIDPDSLSLKDKVVPLNTKVNLDTKPPCKQESDSELVSAVLKNINAKRQIHKAKALTSNSNLAKSALAHAKALAKTNQLKYSANEGKQSEIAVLTSKKPGECLTGKEVVDKWYAEAKIFFDSKISLSDKATKAKRFMQAMWSSTKSAGVGVHKYKTGENTGFVVVAFLTPKAPEKSLKSSTDVAKNVFKGSYKGLKDELSQDDTESNTEVSDDANEVETQEYPDTTDESTTDPYASPKDDSTAYDTNTDDATDYGSTNPNAYNTTDDPYAFPTTDNFAYDTDDTNDDPYTDDNTHETTDTYNTADDVPADPNAAADDDTIDADDLDIDDDAMPWDQ